MYHISQDPRTIKSADLIWQGLVNCLQEKALLDITVTDLHKVSSVSRATFYRLFDRVEDVLHYHCQQVYQEILSYIEQQLPEHQETFFLLFIERWLKEEDLITILVQHQQLDLLYQLHLQHREIVRQLFSQKHALSESQLDYLLAMLASLVPASMKVWYDHGKKEDAGAILQAITRSSQLLAHTLRKHI